MDIKVTLVGYLSYVGSTPLVSASMNPIKVTATDPASTGGTPPGIMPEDAEPVGELVTLSKNGSPAWYNKWDNLDSVDENGKPYYYYIKEVPVSGYSTSYEFNGIINGKIEVNNVRVPAIIVKKKWLDVDGNELTGNNRPDIPVSAVLIQRDDNTWEEKEIPFELNKGNGWIRQFNRNSQLLGEKKGHTYKYKVKEISDIEGYEIKYTNNGGIAEGEITIKNQQKLYELPNAGGSGTYLFMTFGSTLVSLACMIFISRRRKIQ